MPRGVIALMALALAGCAGHRCPPPLVEVVEVPGPVEYIRPPEGLLEPCADPGPHPTTNGELLEAWRARGAALEACNGKLEGIKNLGAPEGP